MTAVALGEVADINPRGEKVSPDAEISFVGMAELDAVSATAIPLETRSFAEVAKGYTVFRDRDILAAKITPCWENGKVGQAFLEHEIGVGSTEFHVIRPSNSLDARYVLHFLRQTSVRVTGEMRMTGSGGQKRVPVGFLANLEIPLPTLDEQRRVAMILDRTDAIRTKRRQILTHLDILTQSIFHNMFGDPGDADETVSFGEVAGLSSGRSLVAGDSTANSPYRVLKISAVTSGQFKAHESKPLPPDYVPPADHLVRPGDLLMSRANTADLVGAVAYVGDTPLNLALPDKVWRFDWRSEGSVPTFYHALFGSPSIRRRISRLSSGSGGSMKNVSKAKLGTMPLPAVSAADQRAFAERAAGVGAQRIAVQRALAADDELFASLQSRAFSGDL